MSQTLHGSRLLSNTVLETALGAGVLNKLNRVLAPFTGSYQADNPVLNLPTGTVQVLLVYGPTGLLLLRASYQVDLTTSPPTLRLLGGLHEGDAVEGLVIATVGAVAAVPAANNTKSTSYADATYANMSYHYDEAPASPAENTPAPTTATPAPVLASDFFVR